MTDYFVLMNEPRRPWLDPDALKSMFLALSADCHPDRFHGASEAERLAANQRFAELNAAVTCLRDPKERLRHLLELETGGPPKEIQRIPPGTMDLFMEVGQGCRDADALVAEKAGLTSPMLKVRCFQRAMEFTDQLHALQGKVNAKQAELFAELRQINAAWATAPPPGNEGRPKALPLERLEQLYRICSYTARWTEQIQERLVQLAM